MILKAAASVFFFLAQMTSLHGEINKLTFDMLNNKTLLDSFSGQEVEVRGFCYKSKEGRCILASQPDLKSCCVGSIKKIESQIVLLGRLPEIPLQRAVTLQGYFAIDPIYNEDDELIGLYYLKNIKLLNDFDDSTIYTLVVLLIILLFIGAGLILYRRNK